MSGQITKALTTPHATLGDALSIRRGLNLDSLRMANVTRCQGAYHSKDGIAEWTPTDWATAMAGECGEACNEVKKLRRIAATPERAAEMRIAGEQPDNDFSGPAEDYPRRVELVGEELADLIIYADLLAARLGIDLAFAVARKFNRKSEEIGSPVRLASPLEAD